MKKYFLMAGLGLMMCANLIACTAEVKGGDDVDPIFRGGGANKTVKGPNLAGKWQSGCLDGWFASSPKRVIALIVEGSSMEHRETTFSDSDCQSPTQTAKLKGTYSYEKKTGDVYLMKLRIPINANVSTWRYYNVSKKGDSIMITDSLSDDAAAQKVPPKLELKKVEGSGDTTNPGQPGQPGSGVIDLQSGSYVNTTAGSNYCPLLASVGKVNGKIFQLYLDFQGACNTRLQLSCDNNVCENSRVRVTFLSANSFELYVLEDNAKAIYQKQ